MLQRISQQYRSACKHLAADSHHNETDFPRQHVDWLGIFYAGLKVRGLTRNTSSRPNPSDLIAPGTLKTVKP